MKLPTEKLKAAMRKRREEAGEVVRPAKKVRRKAQGKLAQASEAPAETAPVEATPVKESREGNPAEALASEDASTMAKAGVETGGQSAQAEGPGDGLLTSTMPVEVVNLDDDDEPPVSTEPAEVAGPRAKGGHPAPPGSEAKAASPEAGDREGSDSDDEAEPVVRCSSPSWDPCKQPRRPLRFSVMDSGRLAERLLERIHLPKFYEQLQREPLARVLNATYVSVLQTTNEVLTLRDALVRTGDVVVKTRRRLAKYQGRCKELAGKLAKSQVQEAEAVDKQFAADSDRQQ